MLPVRSVQWSYRPMVDGLIAGIAAESVPIPTALSILGSILAATGHADVMDTILTHVPMAITDRWIADAGLALACGWKNPVAVPLLRTWCLTISDSPRAIAVAALVVGYGVIGAEVTDDVVASIPAVVSTTWLPVYDRTESPDIRQAIQTALDHLLFSPILVSPVVDVIRSHMQSQERCTIPIEVLQNGLRHPQTASKILIDLHRFMATACATDRATIADMIGRGIRSLADPTMAVAILTVLGRSVDRVTARAAIRACGNGLGRDDVAAQALWQFLLRIFTTRKWRSDGVVIDALSKGVETHRLHALTLRILETLIRSPRPAVRALAVLAIGDRLIQRLPPSVAESLGKLLWIVAEDHHWLVRFAWVRAVRHGLLHAAIPPSMHSQMMDRLAAFSTDRRFEVVFEVIATLQATLDYDHLRDDGLNRLWTIVRRSRRSGIRSAALYAIGMGMRHVAAARSFLPRLGAYRTHRSPVIRAACAQALGTISAYPHVAETIVSWLVAMMTDPDRYVRISVRDVLLSDTWCDSVIPMIAAHLTSDGLFDPPPPSAIMTAYRRWLERYPVLVGSLAPIMVPWIGRMRTDIPDSAMHDVLSVLVLCVTVPSYATDAVRIIRQIRAMNPNVFPAAFAVAVAWAATRCTIDMHDVYTLVFDTSPWIVHCEDGSYGSFHE